MASIMHQICILDLCMQLPLFTTCPILINFRHFLPFPHLPSSSFHLPAFLRFCRPRDPQVNTLLL
jgi:hypothetical protein